MVRTCRNKDRGRCDEKMEMSGHRNIGRLKLRWRDIIPKDTTETGVQREEAQETGVQREEAQETGVQREEAQDRRP